MPGRRVVTVDSWARVKDLLHRALALEPAPRAAFLDANCGSDAALRAELNSLLAVNDELTDGFLRSPVPAALLAGMAAGPVPLAAGDTIERRFLLIRPLGEGGMGQVWLAKQTTPVQRPVALKLIRAGMYDERVAQRFQSECQALALMNHPAIARVFDAGTTAQGQPYLVMEYVPGPAITTYCDEHTLGIRERLQLFIRACDGVQHAHQKAVMHRDLKPANILIADVDGHAMPRIIDFGLAKPTERQHGDDALRTQLGQFLGTPGYMSPEQVDPQISDVDTRADVYSLGVILYVLLTGLQPFEKQRRARPSLDVWLRQLRDDDPPPASDKLRHAAAAAVAARGTDRRRLTRLVRGDLDVICGKALERDRERRYASAAELAADLRRYLNDEPIMARASNAAYQIGKFIRRHRFGTAVAGVVFVLALAAAAAGMLAVQKQHEAQALAARVLQAQSRLLTQAAHQHLSEADVPTAQRLILEVLTNPGWAEPPAPLAVGVFQAARAADAELAVLSGHTGILASAVYSPDGSRILTASEDRTARLWDARTGIELLRLTGHADSLTHAAFSPDGSRIVTASMDGTARLWDAVSGAALSVLTAHQAGLYTAIFSPDGTRIATTSVDRTARIWDARSGALLLTLSGHGGDVDCAAYSPDGTRLVTSSDDQTARIWDARSGALLIVLSGHGDIVNSAAFSPDGGRIVTASLDRTTRVWDAATGAQLSHIVSPGNLVYSARFSANGAAILTAHGDHTARLWDAHTGAQQAVFADHGDRVVGAEFSPDGRHIVTASMDGTARIWNTPGAGATVLTGHGNSVLTASYSPDGTRIVTASLDRTARVWDVGSGVALQTLSGHGEYVVSAAYSPDAAHIVTASIDKTARIWDARSGGQLAVLSGHRINLTSAAFSPDGTRIVTASLDGTARLWDARTAAPLGILSGHGGWVYTAAYSHDGRTIVTASRDGTARLWDAATLAPLAVFRGHTGYVYSARFSPDGARLVTASDDQTVRIWDVRTGAQLMVLAGLGTRASSAEYSQDGSRIVAALGDGTAGIWDAHTGALLALLTGHSERLRSAAFSPDGTHVVTASNDHTARIWDIGDAADLGAQMFWERAAQTGALTDADRQQLGIPPEQGVRAWPTAPTACDRSASADYDPQRLAPGTALDAIAVAVAEPACTQEATAARYAGRAEYELGRVLLAKGDLAGARRWLQSAASRHYRAADVDLADSWVNASQTSRNTALAVSLYGTAWADGVVVAASRLGRLYEAGLTAPAAAAAAPASSSAPPPPASAGIARAWQWYQRGADAGEPYALARFAEREEHAALTAATLPASNARLLQAFIFYAAAAERARQAGWPDAVSRHWRYRRGSLARVLAEEHLMQPVADAYAAVLRR